MKKSLIRTGILLLVVFLVNGMSAQVSVGLRGGVNLARWEWEKSADVNKSAIKNMTGIYVAAPVEIAVTPYFSIQPELAFIQKGVRLNDKTIFSEQTLESDARTILNYLEVPVLAKAHVGNELFRVFAVAGPEVAYALNGKVKLEMTTSNGTTETSKTDENIDFKDANMSRFDAGLLLGGGVEMKVGVGSVILDARYNLGLTNLSTDSEAHAVYNRGIMLSAGFKVPLVQ